MGIPKLIVSRKLIKEAAVLAEKINIARFEGRLPEAEDTVRLTEILDKISPEERV